MQKTFLIFLFLGMVMLTGCTIDQTQENDLTDQLNKSNQIIMEQTAVIKTNLGNITVKLFTEDAPKTVENFVKLAQEGFYDNVKFHRVIKDFMLQAGDPLSKDDSLKDRWGTGGPGYTFADEINDHLLVKGSLAMANAGPNTNGSQFFIVTAESTPWLDGLHTNFGEVTQGMNVVEQIENVQTSGPDRPINDVIILGVEIK